MANFQKEADILTEIRHPNIVSILDRGDGEDTTGNSFSFIVLAFMAGGDMFDYCRTKPNQILGLAETLHDSLTSFATPLHFTLTQISKHAYRTLYSTLFEISFHS